jgi:hypothetical protein
MKKEYKYRMALGLILLLLGIVVEIFWKGVYNSLITSIFVLFGLILILISVLRHLIFREEPEKDERTTKISVFAMAYAWLVAMGFVGLLLWLDKYNLIKITAPQALMSTFSISLLAMFVFQLYFRRKGDV